MSKRVKYMGPGDLEAQISATDLTTSPVADKLLVARSADKFEDLFTLENLIEAVSAEYDWSWEEAAHAVIDSMRDLIDVGLAAVYNVPD